MDTGAQDAALDDLLAELDTDIPNDPPMKRSKMDKAPRKSLPVKTASQPAVAKPRRDTAHPIKSRPPHSQSTSSASRPKNPYSVKPQQKEPPASKISPVKQSTTSSFVIHIFRASCCK